MTNVNGLKKVNEEAPTIVEPKIDDVFEAVNGIIASLPEDMRNCKVVVELSERAPFCDAKTLQFGVTPGKAQITVFPSGTGGRHE